MYATKKIYISYFLSINLLPIAAWGCQNKLPPVLHVCLHKQLISLIKYCQKRRIINRALWLNLPHSTPLAQLFIITIIITIWIWKIIIPQLSITRHSAITPSDLTVSPCGLNKAPQWYPAACYGQGPCPWF